MTEKTSSSVLRLAGHLGCFFFFFPSEVSQVLQFLLLIAIGSKRDSLVNYLHLIHLPIYSSFNESLSVAMCTLRHPMPFGFCGTCHSYLLKKF